MTQFFSLVGRRIVFLLVFGLIAAVLVLGGYGSAHADPPVGPIAYLPQTNGFNTLAYDTHAHNYVAGIPMDAGNYFGVAVNPAGTRAYVSNYFGNDLIVIDTATNEEVADIPLAAPGYEFLGGCRPGTVIVSSDNQHVYVACTGGQRVYEIDAETNTITKDIGIGGPAGLELASNGIELYVGSTYNYTLRMVNLNDPNYAQRILQVRAPGEIVRQPGSSLLYMSHSPYDDITIINPASSLEYPNGRIIGSLTVDQIRDMEFSPDGSTLYITRQPYDTPYGEIVTFDTAQVVASPQEPINYDISGSIQVPFAPTVQNLDTGGACMIVQRPESFGMFELDMHTLQVAREYFVGYGLGTPGRFLMPTPASQWVEFQDTSYTVNDTDGQVHVIIRRGCNSTGQVTVHYETSDDSALAGVQYQATSGDLTFEDGELSKTVDIPILDDHAYHGYSQFNIVLSDPSGADLGDPSTISVAIEETTANAELRLSVQPDEDAVDSGDPVTYCFNIINNGPSVANTVTFTAEIPQGATFASYTFDDCNGGGSNESRVLPQGRVPGNAFPTLDPTCTTPAVGEAGTISCVIPSAPTYPPISLQIVLNITAANGQVTFGGQVASDTFDPYPENNSSEATVSLRSDVYVSADGSCSAQPCFETIQQGMQLLQNGKTLYIAAGTYPENVSLSGNRRVELTGDVTIEGSLELYGGTFVSTPNTLTLKGSYLYTADNFDPNEGTVVLATDGSMYLNSNATFHNLTIQQGTIVEASYYQITVEGAFNNHGILRGYSYNYFTAQEPLLFNDASNEPGVALTDMGEDSAVGASVTIGSGEAPTTCGDDPFPATAVQRSYEISPFSYENIALTVRFYFDDAEAQGINLNTLSVYHCNGAAWETLGGTYGVDENGRKYVEITGVNSFSPFGLGGSTSAAPTSATLVNAKAKAHKKGGAALKWETGTEANVLGFNIWRSNKQDGTFETINASPIAAESTGQIEGHKYSLRDKKAKAGKNYFYKVQVIHADGISEWSNVLRVKLP